MLPWLLLPACLSWLPATLPPQPAAAAAAIAVRLPGDDKALKALDAWLKLYRAGKIDYRSQQNIAKDSLVTKFGLPKDSLGSPTWAGDLDAILGEVAKLDTAEAADAVLEVAAIGLEQGRAQYKTFMAPFDVRAAAEKVIPKFTSAAAKEAFARATRGETKFDRDKAPAMRAAAVRCLGLLGDGALRPTIENALGDGEEIVRIQAAEALARLGADEGALALIAELQRETSDAALVSVAQALRSIYSKYLPKPAAPPDDPAKSPADAPTTPTDGDPGRPKVPAEAAPAEAKPTAPPESVRLAVRAAIAALGRTTWRADMALIRLLDDFRSQETVPALIGVLERFQANPDDVKTGKTSGLLLYQAHELLVAMTGAVIPADQPAKWRELWDRERDKIVVTQKREPKVAGATVSGGFCGIPVQGTRVIFVLDLSGSMEWPMEEEGTGGKKSKSIRLDFAKRELNKAIDALAPNAMFTLVTFNGDDKADVWSKELVPATSATRERFRRHVARLEAKGGTNLWSALEAALRIKSLLYGNRYETNVDEVFLLSDGAPTVGDVTDGIEILRLVQECNRFAGVHINTFYISSATPPEYRRMEEQLSISPKELMRRLAAENQGQFREL